MHEGEHTGLTDIDPRWAGDASHLPGWFVDALAVPREEGFVIVEGAKVHFLRWGDRAKPGILMAHGFLAHARCWAFIAPFLAADYHVVAYDLAGMGDSEARAGLDAEARGREMIAVAAATGLFDGLAPPVIVGHSFGAGIAVTAMSLAADRFSGAIICDLMIMRPEALAAYWRGGRGSPGSGDPNKPASRYPDYPTARGRYVLAPPQPVGQPFLIDYMAYHSLRQDGDSWTWKFSPKVFARGNSSDEWMTMGSRVAAAPGRIAIVHGELSALFGTDSAAYMRDLGAGDIPVISVPNARHHLMLDEPLAFVVALRGVLALWK
jgi:pimeloyl-ACP methyl ester carboxylesterase